MKLDLKNLGEYIFYVASFNDKEPCGSGFFCHPQGYFLTCYHVIEEFKKTGQDIIIKSFIGESFFASIYRCSPDIDMAILKVESERSLPFLPLDTYDRFILGDEFCTFGYPADSEFCNEGISVEGNISGKTKKGKLDVYQITGQNLSHIYKGYSGAPILCKNTKKVIGLVYAEYPENLGFFIPITHIVQKWNMIREYHDVFTKIKGGLRDHVIREYEDKIKDNPFIHLGIQRGLVREDKRLGTLSSQQQSTEWHQNRIWHEIEYSDILPPSGFNILSSSVGTGKTTLLLKITSDILDIEDHLAFFIPCPLYSEWNPGSFAELKSKIIIKSVEIFNSELSDSYEMSYSDFEFCIDRSMKSGRITFLFDGLDQIEFPDKTVQKISRDISSNRVVVSSRPSAVIQNEIDESKTFLRLNYFSPDDEEFFFGKYFPESRWVQTFSPELTRNPMLASMVNALLKSQPIEDIRKNIRNRSDLYFTFVNYIINIHNSIDEDIDEKEGIRDQLREISYLSINHYPPYIQIVPINFTNRSQLFKIIQSGLVNRIIERNIAKFEYHYFIYFTHQSFQEYLAAEYIVKSSNPDELIDVVISESWKWTEILRFIVGFKGVEIIIKILNHPDNSIHSNLFLAVGLLKELRNADYDVWATIFSAIEKIDNSVFLSYIEKSINYLEKVPWGLTDEQSIKLKEFRVKLSEKFKEKTCTFFSIPDPPALDPPKGQNYHVPTISLDNFVEEINDPQNREYYRCVVNNIENDTITSDQINDIIYLLWDESVCMNGQSTFALTVLEKVSEKFSKTNLDMFFWLFRYNAATGLESSRLRSVNALKIVLKKLQPKPEFLPSLLKYLDAPRSACIECALICLENLEYILEPNHIFKIIDQLKSYDEYVVRAAINAVISLNSQLSVGHIKYIENLLCDKEMRTREAAFVLLRFFYREGKMVGL